MSGSSPSRIPRTASRSWLTRGAHTCAHVSRGQRRRRAYAVRFTNLALLNQVMGKAPGFRRHLPAILFIAGLAGLLLSMARPQASIRVPKGQTSVVLAVDVSGSMAATDVQPTRI